MNAQYLVLTLLCVVGIALGQVLFKMAAVTLDVSAPPLLQLRAIFLNPVFLAALAIYLAATALWIWILRVVPLTIAYPFMALAFVAVPLLGAALLGEALNERIFAGTALIVAALYVIAH